MNIELLKSGLAVQKYLNEGFITDLIKKSGRKIKETSDKWANLENVRYHKGQVDQAQNRLSELQRERRSAFSNRNHPEHNIRGAAQSRVRTLDQDIQNQQNHLNTLKGDFDQAQGFIGKSLLAKGLNKTGQWIEDNPGRAALLGGMGAADATLGFPIGGTVASIGKGALNLLTSPFRS